MADYYSTSELNVIRQRTALWIAEHSRKLANGLKYGEEFPCCAVSNLEYMVATLHALECYTAVTTSTDDGEINCLTEAQVDDFVTNIRNITGYNFAPKGSTLLDKSKPADSLAVITFNSGDKMTSNTNADYTFNETT